MDNAPDTNEPLPEGVDPIQLATVLSSIHDADYFATVAKMLSDDVKYRIGDAAHQGPDAVAGSYRDGSAMARRIFEKVEYSHEIIGLVGECTVRIDYADNLSANGEHIEHHSIQDVEVGHDGRIVTITDQPVAGQQERIAAFLARHGLTREESPSS